MADESVSNSLPTACNNRLPRRIKLTEQQFEKITLEELVHNWHEQDLYIDIMESQTTSQEAEIASLRESEERMRQQHLESTHREKVLVRRLATKEQEMQEYANQIAEFKAGQTAGSSALRSALLDPAVNLLLQVLRGELLSTRTRLEETQNELSAWKFTPDSNTGKRLMAKCRLLYQENEELGRMISSGRLAKLEGELALQKSFSDEVKKSQSELDEFLQDLDEDVEGMQSTIYYLQQELRKSKEAYLNLQQQKSTPPAEVCNGYINNNKTPLNVVKEPPISTPVEVKVEPEPYSSKPSSPLPKDEPVSQTLADADVAPELPEETIQEEIQEVQEVKSEPCDMGGEMSAVEPEVLAEDKIETVEKVADLEENPIADSEAVEVVDEVIENDNNGGDEIKEETDDQDSQGELMIEVGSEPRDTEDDEEAYGKSKEEEKSITVGPVNGLSHRVEVEKEDEDDDDQPLRRKRAAPESSPNSSDEDSDDTPLIKKVRRNHELLTKSKA